jgi:hypothetical protein
VLSELLKDRVNLNNIILAHNTSIEAKAEILRRGFHFKKFGETSKQTGQNYHTKDPRGIFFQATDKPYRGDELSWKGKGNTDTVYARFNKANPLYVREDSDWREELLKKYHAEDGKQLTNALLKKGYDTIIIKDKYGIKEVIVLKPKNLDIYNTFSNALNRNDYQEDKTTPSPYGANQEVILRNNEFSNKA